MKQETIELFLDNENKRGGFFELAIKICPRENLKPVELYTDYIWTLNNVYGPLDDNFNKISTKNNFNDGILILENYEIPFTTIVVQEDKGGCNWFDISIYTQIVEKIFGDEYITWNETPKYPSQLVSFFEKTLCEFNKIYPFQYAIIGFEVSGKDLDERASIDSEYPKYYVNNN